MHRSAAAAKIQGMQPMDLLMKKQGTGYKRRLMSLNCRPHPRLHLPRYSAFTKSVVECASSVCNNTVHAADTQGGPSAFDGALITSSRTIAGYEANCTASNHSYAATDIDLHMQVDFDADITADEMQMMTMMGIPFGFDSTQGKHVEDEASNAGAVKAKEKRRARQYMNRRGGFNRPLPAERTGETARRD